MKYTCEDMIRRANSGEEMEFVLFWGHTAKPGRITKACFSQWYPSAFESDGVTYCCNEQYMMAQKALLFGDKAVYDEIMASSEPKEIKALGRQVSGFDSDVWDRHKYGIVLSANIAKFSQNGALKEFLLGTGDAVLAEASPYDGVWGIRLAADDPRAKDVSSWQGENLLGFALMETRDLLRSRQE